MSAETIKSAVAGGQAAPTSRVGARTVEVPAKSDPRIAAPPRSKQIIDVAGLEKALRKAVGGEVRFDAASKAMYANDGSNFRQVPIGVVIPGDLKDVVAVHRVCAEYGAPILNRGGGTSLSGETVNYAVVIDHSKYLTKIGRIDAKQRTVTCEPGVINEDLNKATGKLGFVFGPDPSSHAQCVIGGNIGNNSCGIHSVQAQLYGPGPRTSDNTHALEIVTYDGERFWVGNGEEENLERIIRKGGRKGEIYAKLRDLRDRYAEDIRAGYQPADKLPRRVSGYNLDELLPERGFNVARALVGTESTCVTMLRATLMLTPAMLQRATVVVAFDDIADAADEGPEIIERWKPIALEGIDQDLIEDQREEHRNSQALQRLPRPKQAGGWLLIEFGSDDLDESERTAREFEAWLVGEKKFDRDRIRVFDRDSPYGDPQPIWKVREGGLGATAFPPDGRDHWPGWEDSAVPPERFGDYIRELRRLYERHGLRGQFYGHFGQGCLHSRISFDLRSEQGLRTYRDFLEQAADLVVSYGGSLSGEHGDGQQRAELLEKQYGRRLLDAMREFKLIWDPQWKMNPGKVIDPYKLDENLKLGTGYNPRRSPTKFAYPDDGGDFAHAALRCVGTGKCRSSEQSQVMCPSYHATREEKHTTRGRARLLFEMLQGEVIKDGWKSREVFDALDLCLACKGCTNDCPVHVDMPTYKSEFLYHHYNEPGRRRPRYAYALGLIDQACRVAARMPKAANLATHTPGLARIVKLAAGVDPRRPAPSFAPITLQEWFRERGGAKNPHGRPVVLFPDTFNNHFRTDVGVACVEAIEAASWKVIMPQGHLCCGRPLYDYGFLDAAQRYLQHCVEELRPYVREGVPVVGMEPSCLAVFKDELSRILPHDDDAGRLKENAYHFPEFFEAFDVPVPQLRRDAVMWGHCHHKATGGMQAEHSVLKRMGVRVEEAEGGCCGLAGSWGFEKGKYQISMTCGEQGLLPAVRDAERDELVITDGFSCATQIEHARVGRRALHVAQVMQMAREHGVFGYQGGKPEDAIKGKRPTAASSGGAGNRRRRRVAAALTVAALFAARAASTARRRE